MFLWQVSAIKGQQLVGGIRNESNIVKFPLCSNVSCDIVVSYVAIV